VEGVIGRMGRYPATAHAVLIERDVQISEWRRASS
jgi:hypothetical protein